MGGKDRAKIIAKALSATYLKDLVDLEEEMIRVIGREQYRDIGDKPVQSALLAPIPPQMGLVETLVNGQDAILELEVLRSGRDRRSFTSPHMTAKELLDYDAATARAEARRLGLQLRFSFHDSDDCKRRPTIVIRDSGCGITPERMPKTILGLNEGEKSRKLYLQGAYGQGGSTAFPFARGTVIVTRRHPDLLADDEEDRVSLAIVRQREYVDDSAETDENDEPVKIDGWSYLVDQDAAGERIVMSIPHDELKRSTGVEFQPGTMVRHVGYECEGHFATQDWGFEESAYQFFETRLFRPALPYAIRDMRTGDRARERDTWEILRGVARRLEKRSASAFEAFKSERLHCEELGGHVRFSLWLWPERDPARGARYIDTAMIITSNGQTHVSLTPGQFRQLFASHLERAPERMLLAVELDELPIRRRGEIFDAHRHSFRRTDPTTALKDLIKKWVSSCEELVTSEQREQERLVRNSSSTLRGKELGARIAAALQQFERGVGARKSQGTSNPTAAEETPELHDPPTFFSADKDGIVLRAGRDKAVMFLTDARNGFLPEKASLECRVSGDGADLITVSAEEARSENGRVLVVVAADTKATAGNTAELHVRLSWQGKRRTLRSTETRSLEATVKLAIASAGSRSPNSAGGGRGGAPVVLSRPLEDDRAVEFSQLSARLIAEQNSAEYGELAARDDEMIWTLSVNPLFTPWVDHSAELIKQGLDTEAVNQVFHDYTEFLGISAIHEFERIRREEEQAGDEDDLDRLEELLQARTRLNQTLRTTAFAYLEVQNKKALSGRKTRARRLGATVKAHPTSSATHARRQRRSPRPASKRRSRGKS